MTLDPGPSEQDEFGVQRALVTIADPRDPAVRASNPQAVRDFELWNAMDQASKDVATLSASLRLRTHRATDSDRHIMKPADSTWALMRAIQ